MKSKERLATLDYLCEVWIEMLISKCKYKKFCILTFDFLVLLSACGGLVGCKARQPTAPTPQMDAKPQFQVRVLLLNNITACTLKTSSPYSIIESIDDFQSTIENRKSGIPVSIQLTAGRITIAGQPFTNDQLTILPDNPHIFNLNGDSYRGKLKLIVNPDSNSFDVVNVVPLESYLAGVVGAEMPGYWEPEALKAQAIAARTYCMHIKKQFGSNRAWDVSKTQAHQVYLGVSAESAQVWDAVNQTQGQVLVCKHSDGGEDIFPAYYSSTCGGHTENSSNVFGDSFEPLVGVPCPYCKDVAKPTFFSWSDVQFDSNNITARLLQRYPTLKQLGEIADITTARQSNYEDFSRLTEVKLLGSTGKSDFLKAEDLRLTIDPTGRKLKSTICQIIKSGDKWAFLSGRGYGHGVGMCQCGAQAMARQRYTAQQILSYYYPGSKISTIGY